MSRDLYKPDQEQVGNERLFIPALNLPSVSGIPQRLHFLILRVGFQGNVLNVGSRVLILLVRAARILHSATAICTALFYKRETHLQ